MPSSYTPSLRLEKQATGENINTWGDLLDSVLTRLDATVAGLKTVALTGNYSLSVANGTDDEARTAIIKTTGTGAFTVTIPSVSKIYLWLNACTGPLTVTTGSGTTVTIGVGEGTFIYCDATNVKRAINQDMGGLALKNVGSPSNATDACTKGYADSLSFAAVSGELPGQSGSAGKFLSTDGSVAGWAAPTVSSISDYASDQTSRAATINGSITTVSGNVTALAARVTPLEQGLETIQTLTIASGVLTIDLTGTNTAFKVTLSSSITSVVYLNPPASGTRKTWTLTFVGTGTANTVTWTHGTGWTGNLAHSGGTAPVINTTNGIHTTLTQWTEDAGATVRSAKGAET